MITPLHNSIHSPEMERNPSRTVWGGVINNCLTHTHTHTHTMLSPYGVTLLSVCGFPWGGVINSCYIRTMLSPYGVHLSLYYCIYRVSPENLAVGRYNNNADQ